MTDEATTLVRMWLIDDDEQPYFQIRGIEDNLYAGGIIRAVPLPLLKEFEKGGRAEDAVYGALVDIFLSPPKVWQADHGEYEGVLIGIFSSLENAKQGSEYYLYRLAGDENIEWRETDSRYETWEGGGCYIYQINMDEVQLFNGQ